VDITQFRIDFPEFSDTTVYPSSMITFWSDLGEKLLDVTRWDTIYIQGIQLFTAHNIVLAAGNVAASDAGGIPGQASGPTQSKSVGAASVSYDTAAAMLPNAGHWNQTIYGRQYLQLARMIGTGAVQIW